MSLHIEPELQFQFDRALERINPRSTAYIPFPILSVQDVLSAHFLIADFFYKSGEGIGGVGPRDDNLLLSTVDRQTVGAADQFKWSTPYEISATLLFGIVCNHPFHDANKRTGLVSCANLLLRSNIALTLNEDELVNFTEDVASHSLIKYPTYRALVKEAVDDPEIVFLARYLRKNSRILSKVKHSVTFRELGVTLRRYGFDLSDPKGNTIDVVYVGKGSFESDFWNGLTPGDRICNIGFPGLSKQVALGDVKRIRKELCLLPEFGVDSDAFYQDADPLTNLISSYEGALRKLAFR
ncbi:type II toxin-antitoxin system death-on-curing family toxin [Tabrizicola sp.]|uniref:type II toxin-antitoxin system death-on-curing family toxin n=1 Tax=Tabrizicola sp. TaxID=2005166 RepID=UPI002734B5FD|nr:type II toxin-antitoxin system death-on-curing family toxin [Tabrizicola sp.]MDP3194953.1 type II toxin-antitoxin system death-on-curing family toxin [Tabrizicola sp.]